ncbi:MAG: hypothetical protein U0893_26620 [Chloroflexota bacterium]
MPRTYHRVLRTGSLIRADDLRQVRDFVDQDMSQLPPDLRYQFAWPPSAIQAGTPIQARYLTDMRDAIQVLWNYKSRPPLPGWTSGTTPGGPSNSRTPTIIRASDVNDLRFWLAVYEANHPHGIGLDTLSCDPSQSGRPEISQGWVDNIHALRTASPPLLVRCDVRGPGSPPGSANFSADDYDGYKRAFDKFKGTTSGQNIPVFALLTRQFHQPAGLNPSEGLGPTTFSNAYIDSFVNAAHAFATQMSGHGVQGYIIWNEPNANQEPLDPEHFAAMIYQVYQQLQSLGEIYWGGVIFGEAPPSNPDQADVNALNFIGSTYDSETGALIQRGIYDSLLYWKKAGTDNEGSYGPWPWTGVNAHVHHDRTKNNVDHNLGRLNTQTSVLGLKGIQDKFGDSSIMIIGEWGIQNGRPSSGMSHVYPFFRDWAEYMFYHSHHAIVPGNVQWGIVDYVQFGPLCPDGFCVTNHREPYYSAFDALAGT